MAQRLEKDGTLTTVSGRSLDGETAQALCVSLWYERLGTEPIKSGDARVIALTDTAHSSGIAAVGAFMASIVALSTAASLGQLSLEVAAVGRYLLAVGAGSGAVVLFGLNYRRVGRIANMVIENVLIEAIKQPEGGALRITVS